MSEQEIFWVGRRPATTEPSALPAHDPAFEAALRATCERAGCPVQRFVAARGEFGSWLVEIFHEGEARRLIWNGQAGRLSFDAPNPAGGWDEQGAEELAVLTPEAVFAAMHRLLVGT
jgi:hypothetical protein